MSVEHNIMKICSFLSALRCLKVLLSKKEFHYILVSRKMMSGSHKIFSASLVSQPVTSILIQNDSVSFILYCQVQSLNSEAVMIISYVP